MVIDRKLSNYHRILFVSAKKIMLEIIFFSHSCHLIR
uniref:Uncharacterized protein n=1 Tax=Rhizophora mucronata TaxID=61149 RepID=A0A2P2Q702_RHIMU